MMSTEDAFYDEMVAVMRADPEYFDEDEAIEPIHVENYTEDLAYWIEVTS